MPSQRGKLAYDPFSPITRVSVPMHRVLQVASLEGYLLKYKTRPQECVEEVTAWCGAVNYRL